MTWLKLFPAWCWWLLALLLVGGVQQFRVNGLLVDLAEQGRELERQIAQRDRLHADTLAEIQRTAAAQVRREQDKRLQLEQDLAESSQTEHRKLTNAEQNAARLRDRLATAELRLSVLLASPAASSAGGDEVPAAPGAGRMVDGAGRADIDPGSAQRIVSIAGRGDRAIIALTACQAYVRMVAGDQ